MPREAQPASAAAGARLTPRQLRYFIEIVKAGSLSGASGRLGIAQPALSQHIGAMEEALGARLFERHARGMKITAEGQRLYGRALSILDQLGALREDVRDAAANPRGRVRLAIAGALSTVLAAPLLRAVGQRYPDIRLDLMEGLSQRVAELIESRAVDLAIFPGAADMEGVSARPLFTEKLYLFGAPGSLPGRGRTLRFARIAGCALVAPDRRHDLRKMMEREAVAQGLRLDVRYELNSAPMTVSLVREGLACAILPRSAFGGMLAAMPVQSRLIVEPQLSRVQSLVWSHDHPLGSAARALVDLIVEVAGQAHARQDI
jgi:LysR family nitrogen assimilation transcriptional regulator